MTRLLRLANRIAIFIFNVEVRGCAQGRAMPEAKSCEMRCSLHAVDLFGVFDLTKQAVCGHSVARLPSGRDLHVELVCAVGLCSVTPKQSSQYRMRKVRKLAQTSTTLRNPLISQGRL